jgi:ribonuclease-3
VTEIKAGTALARSAGRTAGPKRLKPLETALGYQFQDRKLLRRALTHASTRSGGLAEHDNERLEFLGDRVLGLAVAELLAEMFPAESEGELARRYNRLVRRETCASVGAEIKLGRFLVLSGSEEESGGRAKATILGDACEAVLGAIFLDGGFEPAREVVRRLWTNRIGTGEQVRPDAKSALQEWAQGRGLALPDYAEIVREGPDHRPLFTAEVRIRGLEPARGKGASKRLAEQDAATTLLVREGVWTDRGDEL